MCASSTQRAIDLELKTCMFCVAIAGTIILYTVAFNILAGRRLAPVALKGSTEAKRCTSRSFLDLLGSKCNPGYNLCMRCLHYCCSHVLFSLSLHKKSSRNSIAEQVKCNVKGHFNTFPFSFSSLPPPSLPPSNPPSLPFPSLPSPCSHNTAARLQAKIR